MTVATVLPLLLLALIWDSHALENLKGQHRELKKGKANSAAEPHPPELQVVYVSFWLKPRVRRYMLSVTSVIVAALGWCILELAGFVPNWLAVRVILVLAVGLTLGTLLTRIWLDVKAATAETPAPAAGQGPPPPQQQTGKAPD